MEPNLPAPYIFHHFWCSICSSIQVIALNNYYSQATLRFHNYRKTGNFRGVQCFAVFAGFNVSRFSQRAFYRGKKEPVKFEHVHSKHFALCTWGQTAVKEALECKQDLTMSIYRYLRPVNSLPQADGPLSSSLPPVAIRGKQKRGGRLQHTKETEKRNLRQTDAWSMNSN